ncbi:MAG: hypothetical protein ACE5JX_04860 [Acidobacteriota bacterium]
MLSEGLWWAENVLICLLLVRAFRGKFLCKYAVFYFYLGYVLLESLSSYYIYVFHPSSYEIFYWYTQFLSVALGYCIIWEIYTQALADFAGAARMARLLLAAIFLLAVFEGFMGTFSNSVWSPAEVPAVLERNLRTVQALLLAGVTVLVAYYAIPVGRNLKGMIVGYGVFISASVTSLALRSHLGKEFQIGWQYLQPIAYFLTLIVWCASLWSYHSNPRPKNAIGLEHDYEILAARMATAMAKTRDYIVKVVNS